MTELKNFFYKNEKEVKEEKGGLVKEKKENFRSLEMEDK